MDGWMDVWVEWNHVFSSIKGLDFCHFLSEIVYKNIFYTLRMDGLIEQTILSGHFVKTVIVRNPHENESRHIQGVFKSSSEK